MTTPSLGHFAKKGVLTAAALLAVSAVAYLQAGDDTRRDRDVLVRLATGQFVSPTIISNSTQQHLNPGLPAYPDFVAGEAVRSRLSPDGTTLAILTAGQNSLYKPDGTVDAANSTQYLFIYDVTNSARTSLMQVIK